MADEIVASKQVEEFTAKINTIASGAASKIIESQDVGLIDLQNENEALRARDELRDKAEGQVAFDVVAQLEAAKAERAADKAGFEAVIRELRAEVAALKGGVK